MRAAMTVVKRNTAKEDETERSRLQAALDQANAEVERLKTELAMMIGLMIPSFS
jgi:hypothetical protein